MGCFAKLCVKREVKARNVSLDVVSFSGTCPGDRVAALQQKAMDYAINRNTKTEMDGCADPCVCELDESTKKETGWIKVPLDPFSVTVSGKDGACTFSVEKGTIEINTIRTEGLCRAKSGAVGSVGLIPELDFEVSGGPGVVVPELLENFRELLAKELLENIEGQ